MTVRYPQVLIEKVVFEDGVTRAKVVAKFWNPKDGTPDGEVVQEVEFPHPSEDHEVEFKHPEEEKPAC